MTADQSSGATRRLRWWQRYDWRFAWPIGLYLAYIGAVLYVALEAK